MNSKERQKCIIIAPKGIDGAEMYQVRLLGRDKVFLVWKNELFVMQRAGLTGSSLINSHLSSKTEVLVISPFDPLILLLPELQSKQANFCDFHDILNDSGLSAFTKFPFKISTIADIKEYENKDYARLNPEKLSSWMNAKYLNLQQSIGKRIPWAEGTYDNGETARKVALGIMVDFFGKETVFSMENKFMIDKILHAGSFDMKRAAIDHGATSVKHLEKGKSEESKQKAKMGNKKKPAEPMKRERGQMTLNFSASKKK